MRYLSVCSGIEAATVAFHPLGWQPVAFSEIDRFPCAVLKHHYPHVPNWGDMTRFHEWPDATVDVLVGGTPCQSFSVAGLRAGLADPRGNLALTFLAIADRYRPKWVVWENVPGVLSSTSHVAPDPCPPPPPMDLGCDGAEVESDDEYDSEELHAFNSLLAGFSELGYFGAYGTLDAQHFGLAQRRERVFAVFHLGSWQRAAAVLLESASLSGHPPPSRESREDTAGVAPERTGGRGDYDVAPTLPSRRGAGGTLGSDFDSDGGVVIASTGDISHCLNAGGMGRIDYETETLLAHSLRADGFDASEDGIGRGTPLVPTYALRSDAGRSGKALTPSPDAEGRVRLRDAGFNVLEECAPTLDATAPHTVAYVQELADPVTAHEQKTYTHEGENNFRTRNVTATDMAVRRLTPRECERLQGFPDDYTLIPYRGKPAVDGPRYKALGNSMAVPVMSWIGRRIQMVEEI